MDTTNGSHDATPERDDAGNPGVSNNGAVADDVRGGDTAPIIASGQPTLPLPAGQAQAGQPQAGHAQEFPSAQHYYQAGGHPAGNPQNDAGHYSQGGAPQYPQNAAGQQPQGRASGPYPQGQSGPYPQNGTSPYPHPAESGANPYASPRQSQAYPAGTPAGGYYASQGNQSQASGQPQSAASGYAGSNPYATPRDAFGMPQGGQPGSGGQPPYGGYPQNGAPQYMWAPQQPPASRRRRRAIALIAGAFATAAVFGVATSFGIAAATGEFGSGLSNASSQGSGSSSGSTGGGLGGSESGQSGFGGSSGSDGSGSGSATSGTLPSATSAQEIGVVDVVSQLTYDSAESAGTGLVLTSNGEILTNNHVVEDATSISVTVVSTGRSYTAKVVGTDETDDIAVLQLEDASGLTKANINSSAAATVGETVTGVGNAGGTGGTPSAASGTVIATDQTITTEAEESAKSETLHGLIETNADIQAGDSGGPLYNSSNQAIGIDTAASEGTSQTQGYAIPISTALSLASKIEAGDASSTIIIGYPAFLGVEVAADSTSGGTDSGTSGGSAGGLGEGGSVGGFGEGGSTGGFGEGGSTGGYGEGGSTGGYGDGGSAGGFGDGSSDGSSSGSQASTVSGAQVEQVISGTPAASAGIEAGDTITAVDGTSITSSDSLSATLANYKPGQKVTVTWVDSTGASQSATVTLTQGPAA